MFQRDNIINNYFSKGEKLLLEICKRTIDGCGKDGPDAYVYDLCLYFEHDSKIYKQHFYSENRFDGNYDEDDYVVSFKENILEDKYKELLKEYIKKENGIKENRIFPNYHYLIIHKN